MKKILTMALLLGLASQGFAQTNLSTMDRNQLQDLVRFHLKNVFPGENPDSISQNQEPSSLEGKNLYALNLQGKNISYEPYQAQEGETGIAHNGIVWATSGGYLVKEGQAPNQQNSKTEAEIAEDAYKAQVWKNKTDSLRRVNDKENSDAQIADFNKRMKSANKVARRQRWAGAGVQAFSTLLRIGEKAVEIKLDPYNNNIGFPQQYVQNVQYQQYPR